MQKGRGEKLWNLRWQPKNGCDGMYFDEKNFNDGNSNQFGADS